MRFLPRNTSCVAELRQECCSLGPAGSTAGSEARIAQGRAHRSRRAPCRCGRKARTYIVVKSKRLACGVSYWRVIDLGCDAGGRRSEFDLLG